MTSTESTEQVDFIGTILQPGSSLNPVFLNILDGAFVALFLVFIALAFVTSGNLHIFVLMFIELALWGSVKWYISILYITDGIITTLPRFVHELKLSREGTDDSGKKDQ